MQHKLKHTIAVFTLLLSSTIWLAHAILPHHHHQSQACLLTEHCRGDHDHHSGLPETDPHKHDNNTTSECSLNQLAIVPPPVFKSGNGFPEPPRYDYDIDIILTIIACVNSFSFISPQIHIVCIESEPVSLYLAAIGQSQGLRAPPAV